MLHIKNKMDLAEYKKDVLEKKHDELVRVGAEKKYIDAAHEKFFRAYKRFSYIVQKATEQGIL